MRIVPADATRREAWLALRLALWPDCPRPESALEIEGILRSCREAAFLALDDAGAAVGFAEVSTRPYADVGEAFMHVHEWLDELQREYGPMHRPFRHNTDGVAQVRARWGDRAAQAAEIHIRRDTGGSVPTPHELRTHWGISVENIEPDSD